VTVEEKSKILRGLIRKTGGIAVAFSGGVDSTFLAAVACQELGDRALAVTALSPTYPQHEQLEAAALAKMLGIQHENVDSNELEIPGFADNPVDRCYYCKSELFAEVSQVARKYGIDVVADGTNTDDLDDYRPGRRAAKECGVLSPLLEAGLNKEDIRELSKELKLPTWDKPAFACLASRFPYGSRITEEKLQAVDTAEKAMREMGFTQLRVRHHDDIGRIEVGVQEIEKALEPATRVRIVDALKAAGFKYVALDLEGYRMGSMNEGMVQRVESKGHKSKRLD